MEASRDTAAEFHHSSDTAGDAFASHTAEANQDAVRGTRVKWLIFGVLIPLLPVGARLAAAWLDGGGTFGFTGLFGDGELLVLATVVAAASIGEVLFSFRRGHWGSSRLRTAVITAAALVVVVMAVLFFGLVTYANQIQADAQATAQLRRSNQQEEETRLLSEASSKSAEARTEASRRRKLEEMLTAEITGAPAPGSSGVPGVGLLASRLKAEIDASQQQRVRLEREASQLTQQAQREREIAEHELLASTTELHSGRQQAAEISVVMFIASLLVAYPAVGLAAREQHA